MSASVPVIHPASIADILSFGMFGFALSRYSGLWAGFKTASELIEAGQTVDLPSLPTFVLPPLSEMADGLHVRWPDAPGCIWKSVCRPSSQPPANSRCQFD